MQSKKINDKDKKILSSEFDDLLRHLKKSNLGRNKTMHSYWFPADDGKIRRHKFNKKIKKNSSIDEYETITVESLNKLAKEITQSMFLLNEFRIKCSKLLSS